MPRIRDPSGPNLTVLTSSALGTPLGSPAFVEQYLHSKLEKHKLLLSVIEDVAKVGYSREAHKMLTGYALPRLTHVLKSIPKDVSSVGWMKSVDNAHLSTWMKCVGGETLHVALPPNEREHLAASLDLPPAVRWRRSTISDSGCR